MKHAGNAEFIVWLIVAVVVMVAKGLGKLATPATENDDTPTAQPKPPVRRPAPKRPVVRRPASPPVTPPVMPAVVAETKPEPPSEAPAPAPAPPAKSSRSAQWAAALRDRQNIRNVIIANEIIGQPVSLREL